MLASAQMRLLLDLMFVLLEMRQLATKKKSISVIISIAAIDDLKDAMEGMLALKKKGSVRNR
jgi:hypothetical protein